MRCKTTSLVLATFRMSRFARSAVPLLRPTSLFIAALVAASCDRPTATTLKPEVGGQSADIRAERPLVGDDPLLRNLALRAIGPAVMGGRIDDVAVVEDRPSTIYIGAATGGVWKTTNNGTTWTPIFDDQGVSSIGDIAIAPSNSDIVWVGTGEPNNRQSSTYGDGIYKSLDGGKTWAHMGLLESEHIGRIVIDPGDSKVVYVAAQGHLWGANKERGLFKTTDAGATWTNMLAIDEDTGVTDVAMAANNSQVLYAASYQRRRTAWGFSGGGPTGGIHKTTDGGKTWTKLAGGLPSGIVGRIGLDACRSRPNVVYAIVEHKTAGGVYRSGDAGLTWQRMNELNNRPVYYSQIRCDPNNDQRVYVLGAPFYMSNDGGKTFVDPGTGQPGANRAMGSIFDTGVHSDFHALWVDPHNSEHLILGGDGGLYVSYDHSISWDHVDNIPLGEFYAIGLDMRKPYYVYGGMQDTHSWGGPSATRYHAGIGPGEWSQLDSNDGQYHQVDPTDPFTIYSGNTNGSLIRFDARTGDRKRISPRSLPGEPRYRFNWTSPLAISPHDSKKLYLGGNRLFISIDRGNTWTSTQDLTKAEDRDKFPIMGVLPSPEMLSRHDGIAAWGTITAFAESPVTRGVLWVGTEDGNVQLSKDGGKTWTNVVDHFPDLPERSYVSRIALSHAQPATAYVAFDRHRSNDLAPYLYRTTDSGETWMAIRQNLPKMGWVNVVTEHPKNSKVLFVGTQTGAFVSIDGGGQWRRLPHLPTVPVTDLAIHPRDNDLVIATHGRSLYVLDDVTPISGLTEQVLTSDAHLFPVRPATLLMPWKNESYTAQRVFWGENPPRGAFIAYYLKTALPAGAKISIVDAQGKLVRELQGTADAGLNRVVWDLRVAPPEGVVGRGRPIDRITQDWQLTPIRGPFVLPGAYTVKLTAAGRDLTTTVRVDPDSALPIADAERQARFTFLLKVRDLRALVARHATVAATLSGRITGSRDSAASKMAERIRAIQRKLAASGPGEESFGEQAGPGTLDAGATALATEMDGDGVFGGTMTGPTPYQQRRLEQLAKDAQSLGRELDEIASGERSRFDGNVAAAASRKQ